MLAFYRMLQRQELNGGQRIVTEAEKKAFLELSLSGDNSISKENLEKLLALAKTLPRESLCSVFLSFSIPIVLCCCSTVWKHRVAMQLNA
jgi:hypothetical protein